MKLISIHAAAFILAAVPFNAAAFEYSIDIYGSLDPKHEIVRVTINNCQTDFKVPRKDFESFSKNERAVDDLIKKALERANNGCR